MQTDTVIFDMDGLLIDSEPLWEEAAAEVLQEHHIQLTTKQYLDTRGIRTEEWIRHWFHYFNIKPEYVQPAIETTIQKAVEKIGNRGVAMPGAEDTIQLFRTHNYKIGLASSSPMAVIQVVVEKLNIRSFFQTLTSAQFLEYGKPHPEVYLKCAAELNALPAKCICFEDSFNGMIAAKAARMRCVVIPDIILQNKPLWNAADLMLNSLAAFGEKELQQFQ